MAHMDRPKRAVVVDETGARRTLAAGEAAFEWGRDLADAHEFHRPYRLGVDVGYLFNHGVDVGATGSRFARVRRRIEPFAQSSLRHGFAQPPQILFKPGPVTGALFTSQFD